MLYCVVLAAKKVVRLTATCDPDFNEGWSSELSTEYRIFYVLFNVLA